MKPNLKQIHTLLARINQASLRERALLFAAMAAIVCFFWYQLVMVPLATRRAAIGGALDELSTHATPGSGVGVDAAADEYSALKSREQALLLAMKQTDLELRDAQLGLIDAKQMVAILTDVLQQQKGLTLIRLRNLPMQPLLAAVNSNSSAAIETGPYLHPVELVVQGDYLNVLTYLQAIESRPWGFQWRRMELQSTDTGPEYRFEFTTLSMEPNWLGV